MGPTHIINNKTDFLVLGEFVKLTDGSQVMTVVPNLSEKLKA